MLYEVITSGVTLENHTGYLLRPLDMREVNDPIEAPAAKRYDLTASQTAKPTKYTSDGLDRYAESGLAAGDYAITATMGSRSVDLTVNVASGDTWEEVTRKLKDRLNSSADWIDASTRITSYNVCYTKLLRCAWGARGEA